MTEEKREAEKRERHLLWKGGKHARSGDYVGARIYFEGLRDLPAHGTPEREAALRLLEKQARA